jgi:hypothetical protein
MTNIAMSTAIDRENRGRRAACSIKTFFGAIVVMSHSVLKPAPPAAFRKRPMTSR